MSNTESTQENNTATETPRVEEEVVGGSTQPVENPDATGTNGPDADETSEPAQEQADTNK